MRYKRLELVSQAEGHGFESRLPLLVERRATVFLTVVRFISSVIEQAPSPPNKTKPFGLLASLAARDVYSGCGDR